MLISRRKFTAIALGGIGSIFIGFSGVMRWDRYLYHQMTNPILPANYPPGPLDERTIELLLAATLTIIGAKIEANHYENFFRFRAEKLGGYRRLYEQFGRYLESEGKRVGNCHFTDCSLEKRKAILDQIYPEGRLDKFQKGMFEKEHLLFEKYIYREILSLFARTDVYILLGYESWPGNPVGLDRYTQKLKGRLPG